MQGHPPAHGWRTFLIVWCTQTISMFGSAVAFFAVTIWLTQSLYSHPEQKSELAFALALVALAAMLPRIFGAPVAGSWADRHDRRTTMLVADLVSAIVSAITLGLMAVGMLQLWSLLILTIIYTTASTFHFAAFDTSYVMLVPKPKLARANGMMQTIDSLAEVLSPAIAAVLIALPALARQGSAPAVLGSLREGAALAFGVDALTFLVSASALFFVRIPMPQQAEIVKHTRSQIWDDVRIGVSYIWDRRPLLWLLGTFTVANLIFAPMSVFIPLMVKFNYAEDWAARGMSFESALAGLTMAIGLGGVAGGIAISIWGGLRQRRVVGVVVPMLFAGLMQVIFGLSQQFDLAIASLFLLAFVGPAMNAHSQTIWQTQTPPELQGRVFAVRRLIAQCSTPLGTLIAGVMGSMFNPGYALAVLGIFLVVFCVIQLCNPLLQRVEDKALLDALADGRAVIRY